MWAPTHGCALPLPQRHRSRLGIRQHGPRPSGLHSKCSTDPLLAWILLVGGHEAIIEFALARVEMTCCRDEKKHWMHFVNSAYRIQYAYLKQEKEEAERNRPLTWDERRQLLIEREQQRRNGAAHRSLERSWTKPATPRPRRLSAAERMERAHRKHRYLVTGQ